MTQGDDRLLQALAKLRPVDPCTRWENRVRARCHSELARRESKRRRAERNASLRMRLFEGVTIALLCAYLSTVLKEALRLGTLLYR